MAEKPVEGLSSIKFTSHCSKIAENNESIAELIYF